MATDGKELCNIQKTVSATDSIAMAFTKAVQPMFIMNRQCVISWCNEAYARTQSLSQEELIGIRPWFMVVTPETISEVTEIWKNVSNGRSWSSEFSMFDAHSEEYRSYETVFTPISDEAGILKDYFVIQNDITAHKSQYQHLWKMANHDRLTGLPNRGLFSSILEHSLLQANRMRQEAHVLYLDLDGFKNVNDTFGHDAGDEVLIQVSQRISSSLRESDFVARLGGDEFAIILVGSQSERQALAVAKKLVASINKPIVYRSNTILRVGASVGLATYPTDGLNEYELKMAADSAMYDAKRNGKNQVCVSARNDFSNGVCIEFVAAI